MLKRIIAALLTLMLAVMLLPKAALAADLTSPNPAGHTIPLINKNDTLAVNNGTVEINSGTVSTNFGAVKNNASTGTVADNRGTVDINNGTVTGNNNKVGENRGIVSSNNVAGVVEKNYSRVDANNKNARVQENYGTVYNKGGALELGMIRDFGEVTNNHGTVYNDHGFVKMNGDIDGEKPGVVYNDHGQVDGNNLNSTVHTLGGKVFDNAGVVNRYGDGAAVHNLSGTVYQYRKVTISGTSADLVEVSGLTDTVFNAKWAREDIGFTLTPKPGYYFTSQPGATAGNVVADGEAYRVTGFHAETDISINGVAAATGVAFSNMTANGGDTETTSLLTLTFSQNMDGLAVGDLKVTGATKGALTKVTGETGVYTLSVSDITVADRGSVSVAVQKHGFTFTPANRSVAVRRYTPPPATYTVTYDANGGTGTMTAGTATDGTAFTLPACGFTAPPGKRFEGWAIGSTSGTRVAAGSGYTFAANTAVYAIWENIAPAAYTVTYDANGGTGTMTAGTATDGIAFTLPACGFTAPPGKRFEGWAIGGTSGTRVAAGSGYTFTANTAVYAIWEIIPVTPQVQVSPAAAFLQGAAPQITVTVGEALSGFGLGNLSSVQMGLPDGGMTLLVNGTHYDAEEGSIIIRLSTSFLNTLAPGTYTLQINLTGAGYPAYVRTAIVVRDSGDADGDTGADVPKTGDSTPIAWCSGSVLLAGTLLAIRQMRRKEKTDADRSNHTV